MGYINPVIARSSAPLSPTARRQLVRAGAKKPTYRNEKNAGAAMMYRAPINVGLRALPISAVSRRPSVIREQGARKKRNAPSYAGHGEHSRDALGERANTPPSARG